jgi:hypothetical protein
MRQGKNLQKILLLKELENQRPEARAANKHLHHQKGLVIHGLDFLPKRVIKVWLGRG